MAKNVIEVRNLRMEFGSTTAVHDLSSEVRQGEILGFIGANGAGKSTRMSVHAELTAKEYCYDRNRCNCKRICKKTCDS
jgi:ABC-type multidrug transport system ATPase subunit